MRILLNILYLHFSLYCTLWLLQKQGFWKTESTLINNEVLGPSHLNRSPFHHEVQLRVCQIHWEKLMTRSLTLAV